MAGLPSKTSCFVILPAFPVPVIWLISIFFSSAIFLAAGLKTSDLVSTIGCDTSFLSSAISTGLLAEVSFGDPLAEVSM